MVHIGCDVCYVLHNIFAHGIADDTKMYLPQNQTARVIYRHKRVKVSYLHKCAHCGSIHHSNFAPHLLQSTTKSKERQ